MIGFDTAGVFSQPRTISLTKELVLDRDVSIEGTGSTNLTVTGNDVARVLKVTGGASVSIGDMAIRGGAAPIEIFDIDGVSTQARLGGCAFVDAGSRLTLINALVADCATQDDVALSAGGGLASLDGEISVQKSHITANSAPAGGGIYMSGGVLTSVKTTIDTNTADVNGGGVALLRNASALFSESVIEANSAFRGGGFYVRATVDDSKNELVLQLHSRVTRNSATSTGGGIYMASSSEGHVEAITHSVDINGNTAGSGGGIYGLGGSILVQSSLIYDNVVSGDGGGIFGSAFDIRMTQGSRVIKNRAGGHGGGFFVNLGELKVADTGCRISSNVADDDGNGFGMGGGVYDSGASFSGVSSAVCNNEPDDIAP